MFLTYRDEGQFELLSAVTKRVPMYDFVSKTGRFRPYGVDYDDDDEIAAIRVF